MRKKYFILLPLLFTALTGCTDTTPNPVDNNEQVNEVPTDIDKNINKEDTTQEQDKDIVSYFEINEVAYTEIGRVEEVLFFDNDNILIRLYQTDENWNQFNHLIFVSGDAITATIPIHQDALYFKEVTIGDDNHAYTVEEYRDDNNETHYIISRYDDHGNLKNEIDFLSNDYGTFREILVDEKVHYFYYDKEEESQRHATFNTDFTLHSDEIVDTGNLEIGGIYDVIQIDGIFHFVAVQTIDDVRYIKVFTNGGNVVFEESIKITKVHSTNNAIVVIQFLDWNDENNRLILIDTETWDISFDYSSDKISNNIHVTFISNEEVSLGWPFIDVSNETDAIFKVNIHSGNTAKMQLSEFTDSIYFLNYYVSPNGTVVVVTDNNGSALMDKILIFYPE